MADPRASFSLVLLSLRTASLDFTAPVERTPGIDETCGRGRQWAWDGRGSGFIGVASGCLPYSSSESQRSAGFVLLAG